MKDKDYGEVYPRNNGEVEATRSAVYLFQRRSFNPVNIDKLHDDYLVSESGNHFLPRKKIEEKFTELNINVNVWEIEEDFYINDESLFDILEDEIIHVSELGNEYVEEVFTTEHVFFTRQEAYDYGDRQRYNYPLGFRTYSVCALGILENIIQAEEEKRYQEMKNKGYKVTQKIKFKFDDKIKEGFITDVLIDGYRVKNEIGEVFFVSIEDIEKE